MTDHHDEWLLRLADAITADVDASAGIRAFDGAVYALPGLRIDAREGDPNCDYESLKHEAACKAADDATRKYGVRAITIGDDTRGD